MHDEDDVHEPEHDHLLDQEGLEDEGEWEDAYGALDEVDDPDEFADDDDGSAAWREDPVDD